MANAGFLIDDFQIQVDPDEEFAAFLKDAGTKIDDLTIPFILITKDWFRSNNAIFNVKQGPGKYADLAPDSGLSKYDYKSEKQKAVGFIYPILKRSGRLEQSLTNPKSPDAVSQIVNKKTLFLGTSVPYAIPLHEGTTNRSKMPARPVVLLGAEQVSPEGINRRREAWVAIIENFIIDSWTPRRK